MALGAKIQSLRELQDLTQKELANLAGVTTGKIAEWEADETVPNLAELARLSKALNVSSDDLLDATTEDVTVSVAAPKQEPKPVIAPVKKRKKKGWIIGVAVLCVVMAVAAAVLWYQGVFDPEPLPFSEDTAKIEAADASVVTVYCYNYDGELAATGSGFVAFDGKTVITNYHVMTSAYTCKISTNQDVSYEVSWTLCYSKEQDIAILRLAEDTGLAPLTLGDSKTIKKGETVVAIGSPLGIKNTVSTGVISGRLMEDNMDVLQFTAPISSGSSGGALFDTNGKVIGITYASYVDGQNLNLAIPVELATSLYETKGMAKIVSAIYMDEHPYVAHLAKYKDVPIVTLDDLKKQPEKYDNKTVKLKTYVSSFYDYNNNMYVSDQDHISNDYGSDSEASIFILTYRDDPRLRVYGNQGSLEYIDASIRAGDCVVVIGIFRFTAVGEEQYSPVSDRYYTTEEEHGDICANVIYKE